MGFASHHQHLTVGERGGRGIPAAVVHQGDGEPFLGPRVVDDGLGLADVFVDMAAGDEDQPIFQMRMTRAEDVEASIGEFGDLTGFGIPFEVAIALFELSEEEDFPGRREDRVGGAHGYVFDRGPLPDIRRALGACDHRQK